MITETIGQNELRKWKRKFSMYGAISECHKKTNIARSTIHRILNTGSGLQHNLEAIRQHLTSNNI